MGTVPAIEPQLPIIDMHRPDAEAGEFFQARAPMALDLEHRRVLRKATGSYYVAVADAKSRFLDYETARRRAAAVKREAIEHLDRYLEEFETNVHKNGGHVHWAEDVEQAREIILGIAQKAGVQYAVKSKSMATEEIHLNEAFEEAGIHPIETDLGEFICQLRGEPPYHIVTPVMHLTKAQISELFHEKLSIAKTEVAEELTVAARQWLRHKFVTATMGVTGGNFLIAETGMVAITENEGNARLSYSLPNVHVALVGIEKIIPKMRDLALLWPMLSTSGTGQHLTCYNSVIGGPQREDEPDGPNEFHVVLLDNGRTRLLANAEQRDAAQCIRCGACLNVCPIFKSVGGHSYGTTYQGPIGSVITPLLKGIEHWKHLPYASSLCGNCTEVCPEKIDLHHHLLHNRRDAVALGLNGPWERRLFRWWLWAMKSAARYRRAARLARIGDWWFRTLGFSERRLGNPVRGWTQSRTLPKLARQSFRDWWDEQRP